LRSASKPKEISPKRTRVLHLQSWYADWRAKRKVNSKGGRRGDRKGEGELGKGEGRKEVRVKFVGGSAEGGE